MKLIIAGGRDFKDYDALVAAMNQLHSEGLLPTNLSDLSLISGGAKGADSLAERFAKQNRLKIQVMKAKWDQYPGKSAGYHRNVKMAEKGDFLLAFWNGKSKGTKHMIDIMASKNKPQRVIEY